MSSFIGRSIIVLPLPLLQVGTWQNLVPPKLKESANKHPAVHQLVLSCYGHPRALTDGLGEAALKFPSITNPKDPNTLRLALEKARNHIIVRCKFDAYAKKDFGVLVHLNFNVSETLDKHGRFDYFHRKGLINSAMIGSEFFYFPQPLAMQAWAHENNVQLAKHLEQLYASDVISNSHAEKDFESVTTNFEAALRIGTKGKPFMLEQYYRTSRIRADLKGLRVSMTCATDALGIPVDQIYKVPSFGVDHATTILTKLTEGYIVRSDKRTEKGIEYLVPFVDESTGQKAPKRLLIACTQCKFTSGVGEWSEWKGPTDAAIEDLKKNFPKGAKIELFPVFITTATKPPTDWSDGVYLTATEFDEFTARMGLLRVNVIKGSPPKL